MSKDVNQMKKHLYHSADYKDGRQKKVKLVMLGDKLIFASYNWVYVADDGENIWLVRGLALGGIEVKIARIESFQCLLWE